MTTDKDSENIEDINCTEAIDKLYAYLDGEVDDADSIGKLEYHLEHCHSCFTRSQVESALSARIKNAATKHTPESLQKRLRDMIDKF
ncbi:MAG: zf-HC2 domain-containing protein [Gammaproteobacteria bacterium]|nr:zf-HC2 domain-containing protein [Gammaproteobacteria bacterium]